jgi:hypothetical protein
MELPPNLTEFVTRPNVQKATQPDDLAKHYLGTLQDHDAQGNVFEDVSEAFEERLGARLRPLQRGDLAKRVDTWDSGRVQVVEYQQQHRWMTYEDLAAWGGRLSGLFRFTNGRQIHIPLEGETRRYVRRHQMCLRITCPSWRRSDLTIIPPHTLDGHISCIGRTVLGSDSNRYPEIASIIEGWSDDTYEAFVENLVQDIRQQPESHGDLITMTDHDTFLDRCRSFDP